MSSLAVPEASWRLERRRSSRVFWSNVVLSLSVSWRKLETAAGKSASAALVIAPEVVGQGADLAAHVAEGDEEFVERLGLLGDAGDPLGGLVDRLQRPLDVLEGVGRRRQRIRRVGGDGPLDDRRADEARSPIAMNAGPLPGIMSIATSPIRARETRGTEPSRILYFESRASVTSTPSGWPGRSSNRIADDLADADAALADGDALAHARGLGVVDDDELLRPEERGALAEPDDQHRQDEPGEDDEHADPKLHHPLVHVVILPGASWVPIQRFWPISRSRSPASPRTNWRTRTSGWSSSPSGGPS